MKKILLTLSMVLALSIVWTVLYSKDEPKFYKSKSDTFIVSEFEQLTGRAEGNNYIADNGGGLPLGRFHKINGTFMVRPEGDQNVGGKGAFVYSYPIDEDGNFTIDVSVKNVGTDVTGGDGGALYCFKQKQSDSSLNNQLFSLILPISGGDDIAKNKISQDMAKGDILYFVWIAGIDGFGDQFEGVLNIKNNDAKSPIAAKSDIKPLNDFLFYKSMTQSPKISDFTPLPQRVEGEGFIAGEEYKLPIVTFDKSKYNFIVRPEGDQLLLDKKGSVMAVWTCPEAGNYELSVDIENIGVDVKGGDGGAFALYKATDKSEYLTALIFSFGINVSLPDKVIPSGDKKIVKLNKGDKLIYKWSANLDAYGDRFKSNIKIKKTNKKGVEIEDKGLEVTLATLPAVKKVSPLKIQDGIWIGCGQLDGTFRDFSVGLWQKYFNKLTVTPVTDDPAGLKYSDIDYMDYYNAKGYPVVPQTWGPSYMSYLIFNNGLEYLWNGKYLGQMQMDEAYEDQRISSHDLAMYSKASYKAFSQFVQSAMEHGGAGSGFCDFTFGWMTYTDMGYNPETIDYMRLCLKGKDKGFYVNMNGNKKLIKFKDYCEYYFGGMPSPSDLLLKSWDDYYPVTEEEYKKASNKTDLDQRFILYDMLTSYLWLSFNDMLGEKAIKAGGGFSSMPNPEWFRGSEDFLFGAGLSNLFGIWEEFFQSPGYLDGAYNHYPYFKNSTKETNVGVVMECGGGGNGNIYYSTPNAFLNAYELTASCDADYIEGDFWPNFNGSAEDALKNHAFVNRMRNLLSYGMGFDFAKSDKAKRIPEDLAVISSRRHIRIFNADWQPWSWCLNTNGFTLEVWLCENGYSFSGISQEGVPYLHSKTVLWAADKIVKRNFDSFLSQIKKGDIPNGILMAPACTKVITEKMEVRDFDSVYKSLGLKLQSSESINNSKSDGKGLGATSFEEIWDSKGEIVRSHGGVPVIKKIKYGAGNLYIILTKDTDKVGYTDFLNSLNIEPNWYSEDGAVARIYTNDKMLIVGVQDSVVRDPNIFGKESVKDTFQYIPYKSEKDSSVFVKLEPGKEITVFSFPMGETVKEVCDETGYLKLSLGGVNHQLFYCVEDESLLEPVKKNLEKYKEAMTLGGNIPFNLTENYY